MSRSRKTLFRETLRGITGEVEDNDPIARAIYSGTKSLANDYLDDEFEVHMDADWDVEIDDDPEVDIAAIAIAVARAIDRHYTPEASGIPLHLRIQACEYLRDQLPHGDEDRPAVVAELNKLYDQSEALAAQS